MQKNTFQLPIQSKKCKVCFGGIKISQDVNNIVFIDLNHTREINFDKIPHAICVNDDIFCLIGLVVEVPSLSSDNAHLVAHVKRGKQWYLFDNNSKDVSKSNLAKKNVLPHLLVYALPSLETTNEPLIDIAHDVDLLKNFHEITEYGKKFRLDNVCGPDSLFHSFICLFIDDPQLFESTKNDEKLILFLNAYVKKDMKTAYKHRLDLLKDVFFTNIFPSAVLKCTCNNTIFVPIIDLNYDQLLTEGIEYLENCLFKTKRTCNQCKLKISSMEYSDIIFLDVQPLSQRSLLVPLRIIPTRITIECKDFRLKSVIEFRGNLSHYMAHCLRKDNTFYCYDDLSNAVFISERERIV